MRFKVDESLHVEVAGLLRGQGHDALTVFDQGLRGCDDHDIAETCRSENRVLLSLDLDFSNILMFPPENYPGLIVLRLRKKGRAAVRHVVTRVMDHLNRDPLAGRLWIVDEHRIRIHRVGEGYDVNELP
jgi:predicted nuclease of predicted toxin-antitoxin system